jgi:hypothetical protein
MWALLKNSGISKIATPTSSCIYSLFKLLSFQYTQKEDFEKMVQNPTFRHCTNIKELSKNAQKKCKTNAQKDKELNFKIILCGTLVEAVSTSTMRYLLGIS